MLVTGMPDPRNPPVPPGANPPRVHPSAPPSKPGVRWVRRSAVAKRFGVSLGRLRQLHAEGKLIGHKGLDGWRVFYDLADVERFAETYRPQRLARRTGPTTAAHCPVSGKKAAQVFQLLAQGADLTTVVTLAEVTPGEARLLYGEYIVSLEAGETQRRVERAAAAERAAQRAHDAEMIRNKKQRDAARARARATTERKAG